MTDMEQIIQAIRRLPVRDRLRIVEIVAHDPVDSPSASAEARSEEPLSPIGLFADDPDAVDEMMRTVLENRRASRLRVQEASYSPC